MVLRCVRSSLTVLAIASFLAGTGWATASEVGPEPTRILGREALGSAWNRELALRRNRPPESVLDARSQTLVVSGRDRTATLSEDSAAWSRMPAPAQRSWHAAIYDPVRDRMIVLGGEDWWAGIGYGDTWALTLGDEASWLDLEPEGSSPGLLSGHSAVYDPAGDRILVFGGDTDLWSLTLSDPPTWTPITAAGTPPVIRRGHSAVIDVAHNRMIVFGGWNNGPLQDLWELSLTGTPTWTELTPGAGPEGRDHHSAIVDPVGDRMIVYGGWNDRDDVWQLSLGVTPSWTELTPGGTTPAGRWGHTAILDPMHHAMVVYGGDTAGASVEAWAMSLDGDPSWTSLMPAGATPLGRFGHVAILDSARERMIAYGGEDGNDLPLRDVWSLGLGETQAWGELMPAGASPTALLSSTMIHDAARDRIVVFGGESGGYLNDGGASNPTTSAVFTLPLSGAPTWTVIAPGETSPASRLDHSAVLDPSRDRMVVFGGAPGRFTAATNDVWALDLGSMTWTPWAPAGAGPGARRGHSATLDPMRDRMIVLGGGATSSGASNEVWALSLDGSAWAPLSPAGIAPEPRRGHSAVYDSNGDRLIVFGGRSSSGSPLADVWILSLGSEPPAWLSLAPTGAPPSGRWGQVAVFDAANDRLVIQGGLTTEGPSSEAWALALGPNPAWSPVPTATIPPPRSEHVAAIDAGRERMVVFGGWDGEFVLRNDVWTLDWSEAPSATVPAPNRPVLLAAQPNPYRAGGRIAFELSHTQDVALEVYDVGGRRVETLARGTQTAGRHEIPWTASGVQPGVYFLRLTGDAINAWQRVVIVR
jgi:Galactose oxidase, central domain/Kelch motif